MSNFDDKPIVDIIVLTMDNHDELLFTLKSIYTSVLSSNFKFHISIFDSSSFAIDVNSFFVEHSLISSNLSTSYEYIYPPVVYIRL